MQHWNVRRAAQTYQKTAFKIYIWLNLSEHKTTSEANFNTQISDLVASLKYIYIQYRTYITTFQHFIHQSVVD